MSAPQPSPADAEAEDDEGDAPDGFDEVSDAQPPAEEVEQEEDEVEVDLADTNIGDEVDQAFDRIEDAERPNAPTDDDDFDPFGGRGDDGDADDDGGSEPSGEDIADAIIEGTSRLAVLGLEDEFEVNGETKSKDELREEFADVFTAFRLGDYGEQVAEEYLFVEEDVDPLMGFLAASLVCTAMVLWMRPDGEELAKSAYDRVATLGTGGMGGIL